METLSATLDWLMAGAPAIRWQTMRDLLDEAPATWQAEQQRTLTEGGAAGCTITYPTPQDQTDLFSTQPGCCRPPTSAGPPAWWS